jgi:TIR domain
VINRDVFVSYSQPDRECAFQLTAQLEEHGIGVWIAPRDILPAADWAEEIIEAISCARLMVLVFSTHCNASPQVRREVERAVHRQVPILPFRIEDVLPARSLEYFLSTQHWLDAFPPPREPHYAKLTAHIAALLKGTAPFNVPPTDAPAMPSSSVPVSGRNSLLSLNVTEIESLERRLAYYVGPVAKYLVKRAASKAVDREELTLMLAAEVEAAPARKQFLEACRTAQARPPR